MYWGDSCAAAAAAGEEEDEQDEEEEEHSEEIGGFASMKLTLDSLHEWAGLLQTALGSPSSGQ